MKIKILYEDSNILATEKPAGILVHPAPEQARYGTGPDKKTILDIFRKKYPKLEIVHRLDRDTSGVMLLAKNKKAHEFLKEQFQNRAIKKTYLAIVSGWLKEDRGVINKSIGRSPTDFRRYSATRGARGEMREAVTQYKVLKRFSAEASCPQNSSSCALPRALRAQGGTLGDKNFVDTTPVLKYGGKNVGMLERQAPFTYVEVRPKTGRTHQIRVHMKSIDHPIVCDSLYNPKNPCPKGIKRMALHAKSIEFKDLKSKTIKIESSTPEEFVKVVK